MKCVCDFSFPRDLTPGPIFFPTDGKNDKHFHLSLGNQHLFTIINFTIKPVTSLNISKIKNKIGQIYLQRQKSRSRLTFNT